MLLKNTYMLISGQLHKTWKSEFVRQVTGTMLARLAMVAIGLGTTIIVTRILGPNGRGLYAVAASVGAIGLQFGCLGLHAANTYSVSRNRALLPLLLGNSLLASIVVGGGGAVIAWGLFTFWPDVAPVHGVLLVLSLAIIPLNITLLLIQNLLLGIGEVRAYNIVDVFNKIFCVILLCALILIDLVSVESVFSVSLIATFISVVWVLFRLSSKCDHNFKLSLSLFSENLSYGFKAYLAAFFSFMVLRADLLMVQYLIGEREAGYYSIAAALGDMVYMLPVVIGTILFPKISAIENDMEKLVLVRKVIIVVSVIMLIVVGGSGLVSKILITTMFGDSFLPSQPAFIWLLPGIYFLSINTVCMNYFASIGMPSVAVYSPLVAMVINLCANYYLIPLYGIVGASFSSVAAYGLMLIISFACIAKRRFLVG